MTGEFPFEGLSDSFIVGLKGEQALFDGGQRFEVVWGQDFALDDGEVDFDLIEPAGMNGTVDGNQARMFRLESGNAARPAMRGTIVDDPEDPARLAVRRLLHDLVDESIERAMPVLRSQRPKTLARWTSRAAR